MGVFCFDYKWHGIFITWVPRQVSGQLPPSPTTAEVVAASQLALFRKSGVAAFAAEFLSVDFLQVLEAWNRNLYRFLSWKSSAFKPCFKGEPAVPESGGWAENDPRVVEEGLGFSLLKKRTTAAPATVSVWMMFFFFLKSITGRLAIYLNWLICFSVWPCWTLQGLKCPWRLLQQAARILDAARSIAKGPKKSCEDNLGPREGWFRGCVGGWNATQLRGDYNKPSFQDPYLTTRIQWKVRDPGFFFSGHHVTGVPCGGAKDLWKLQEELQHLVEISWHRVILRPILEEEREESVKM